MRNGVGGNDGVGVDADKNFFVGEMLEAVVERLSLPGVGLGENQHAAFGFFLRKGTARNFKRAIL
jgi:hypothetical protein